VRLEQGKAMPTSQQQCRDGGHRAMPRWLAHRLELWALSVPTPDPIEVELSAPAADRVVAAGLSPPPNRLAVVLSVPTPDRVVVELSVPTPDRVVVELSLPTPDRIVVELSVPTPDRVVFEPLVPWPARAALELSLPAPGWAMPELSAAADELVRAADESAVIPALPRLLSAAPLERPFAFLGFMDRPEDDREAAVVSTPELPVRYP
jgi:hypothetical protein